MGHWNGAETGVLTCCGSVFCCLTLLPSKKKKKKQTKPDCTLYHLTWRCSASSLFDQFYSAKGNIITYAHSLLNLWSTLLSTVRCVRSCSNWLMSTQIYGLHTHSLASVCSATPWKHRLTSQRFVFLFSSYFNNDVVEWWLRWCTVHLSLKLLHVCPAELSMAALSLTLTHSEGLNYEFQPCTLAAVLITLRSVSLRSLFPLQLSLW